MPRCVTLLILTESIQGVFAVRLPGGWYKAVLRKPVHDEATFQYANHLDASNSVVWHSVVRKSDAWSRDFFAHLLLYGVHSMVYP